MEKKTDGPDISPDFTIEDIHKIREWDYEQTKGMTAEKANEYFKKGSDRTMAEIERIRKGKGYCDEKERFHDKCKSFLEAARDGTDIADAMNSYGIPDSTAKMLLFEVFAPGYTVLIRYNMIMGEYAASIPEIEGMDSGRGKTRMAAMSELSDRLGEYLNTFVTAGGVIQLPSEMQRMARIEKIGSAMEASGGTDHDEVQNAETEATMEEVEEMKTHLQGYKPYKSFKDAVEDVDSEDEPELNANVDD